MSLSAVDDDDAYKTRFLARHLIPYQQTLARLVNLSTIGLLVAFSLFNNLSLQAWIGWGLVYSALVLALAITRGTAVESLAWVVGPFLLRQAFTLTTGGLFGDVVLTVGGGVMLVMWVTGALRPDRS